MIAPKLNQDEAFPGQLGFEPPARGLVVREPWISMLLDGTKTWELRGGATRITGRIGLIASGTGLVVGEAILAGCRGPLSRGDLAEAVARHRVGFDWENCDLPYRNVYAWEMEVARRYPVPLSYRHPQGAVIWVGLENAIRPSLTDGSGATAPEARPGRRGPSAPFPFP